MNSHVAEIEETPVEIRCIKCRLYNGHTYVTAATNTGPDQMDEHLDRHAGDSIQWTKTDEKRKNLRQ